MGRVFLGGGGTRTTPEALCTQKVTFSPIKPSFYRSFSTFLRVKCRSAVVPWKQMNLWTFSPPDPAAYRADPGRSILLGAEPHGKPGDATHDMGQWFRSPPRDGTRFLRPIMLAAAILDGVTIDPRTASPLPLLSSWRYLDMVPEEAGARVEGDFHGRVAAWSRWLVDELSSDSPARVILLGSHVQGAFESIIAPLLSSSSLLRLGLPHPAARRPYLSAGEVGDPATRLRPLSEPLLVLGRGGWRPHGGSL